MALGSCCQKFFGIVFHYETVKIVDIKNKKVGALYRFIQLIILAYIIGYVIVYKKGYQEMETSITSVSTKLKGTAFVDFQHFHSPLYRGIQVYDPADYVIPAQENNAFFVMTNMIISPNQTQGKCPEDPKFKDNLCKKDKDCQPALIPVTNGNGVRTGKCVPSDRGNSSITVCEIYGWCPTEIDVIPMSGTNFTENVPLLELAKDFTVLVKNQISFPKFDIQLRNIIQAHDNVSRSDYLKNCLYDKETDPLCPIFKLGQIIELCGFNFTQVAYKGGVFGIIIKWDCDFDYNKDECVPTYRFKRLDDENAPVSTGYNFRLDDENAPISPGYNFRYAQHYVDEGQRKRILTKAYGIKFEVLVNGKVMSLLSTYVMALFRIHANEFASRNPPLRAGKFSPVPLFTNLGAGLALLGIASLWCDFIVMYLLKKRQVYKEYKYQNVEDDLAEDMSEEDAEETKPLVNGYQTINNKDGAEELEERPR